MNAPYGCLAQFASVPALLAAVKQLRTDGYTRLEAYTPFAVDGLTEALGLERNRIPVLMLLGGLAGGFGTLALQYYAAVIDYPIDVGGRPDASWPAFMPAALEMTILFAALAGIVGMLVGNGLPRLNHPLFGSERFEAASRDGLFVLLRADDPRYEVDRVLDDLGRLDPLHVEEVPR
ncbi:ABC transporter permease [Bacillus sp. SRB_336]|nr:ABC transporter permease [Bacillus sp. SRB_336]